MALNLQDKKAIVAEVKKLKVLYLQPLQILVVYSNAITAFVKKLVKQAFG